MIRQMLTAAALALYPLASAGPAFSAVIPTQGSHINQWQWSDTQEGTGALILRLVRGSARIVRREGPVAMTIEATSATGDPAAVTFAVERARGAVTIEDRYVRPIFPLWRECLSPIGERGDFSTSDVVMKAVIYAPAHLPVHVEIMDPRPSASSPN